MVKIALKLFICPFCPYTRGRACSTDPLGGKWHKAESLKGFLPQFCSTAASLWVFSPCVRQRSAVVMGGNATLSSPGSRDNAAK